MKWTAIVIASVLVAQTAAPEPALPWGRAVLEQPPAWYASAAARAIADAVIAYQSPHGGWPKNTDLSKPPTTPATVNEPRASAASEPREQPASARSASARSRRSLGEGGSEPAERRARERVGESEGRRPSDTIDNGATTTPMQFLAQMVEATGEARYRAAFERGVDYLLAAQYPHGGWPQYFPLRAGYYSRITYNDNAMINVLTLLRDAAAGKAPYTFVDEARRRKARAAVERGVDVILRTQVKQDGTLTAWCAQHDEKTLAPAWGRAYEPPSLSGSESVGIVRFLKEIDRPTPAITAAIDGAVAWLRSVAIRGLRVETFTRPDGTRDRRTVADPAAPPIWARFYELGTNRPIFLGRDSVVRYTFGEIEQERRNGYAYYGTWAASLW